MKGRFLNSFSRYKFSNTKNSFIPFGSQKYINKNSNNTKIPATYKPDSLRYGINKKLDGLQASSEKNYNKTVNDGNSEKTDQNYKTIDEELKKGNNLINKIMSAERKGHIIGIMESFDKENSEYGKNVPFDMHLRQYFLKFKFTKSEDKEFIANQAYSIIRYKGLIDFLTKPPLTWLGRFDTFYSQDFERQKDNVNIPE